MSLCFFAATHILLSWLLCERPQKKRSIVQFPTFVVNFPYMLLYAFLICISVFHMESVREMQSTVPADHFEAYVLRSKPKYTV